MPAKSRPQTVVRRAGKKSAPAFSLDGSLKRRFQHRLLKWYGANGRDLPWRKTSDPYHILVSEVMLQQTQVDRVIPKYQEFLDRYPGFKELAAAPVEDVRKTWYPLGYNIRPERLHSIACETVVRTAALCRRRPNNYCPSRESGGIPREPSARSHSRKPRPSWTRT